MSDVNRILWSATETTFAWKNPTRRDMPYCRIKISSILISNKLSEFLYIFNKYIEKCANKINKQ